MSLWEPKQKQYPHFDAPLSKREMIKLATNSARVATHEFLPFLKFDEEWQPFRGKRGKVTPKPAPKTRPIRYASRRDSAVFSYYRWLLAERFEAKLADADLQGSVLAYRRIVSVTGVGKSNINFAFEAFQEIQRHDRCVVVALDISKFFESLDHQRLDKVWCWLLGEAELPPDHKHVFRNITRYADVPRDEAYVRLEHAEWVRVGRGRRLKIITNPMPIQLSSMAKFRERIAGKGGTWPKLITRHKEPHGVPQGAPLSDLLANAYLFEFDVEAQKYARERGGGYFRYSDDILIIIPTDDPSEAGRVEAFAQALIKSCGDALQIKAEKTSAYVYHRAGSAHNFQHLKGKGVHGLEYLGFRFDGRFAHIRASTLSRLHRNITLAARATAFGHVARYPGKSLKDLVDRFSVARFMQRFGRVRDFRADSDPGDWTFWTYAVRAKRVFGRMGQPIERQLSRHRQFVRWRVEAEIARAYRARQKAE